MLIKIAKNGIESEWFQLTKKHHRTLLLEKPDVVFVHIDSLYPKSPESGQIVELSFPCFNLLAREFVLEENRQEKQNERHQDYRAVEDINPRENGALMTSLEEIYLRQEIKRILNGPSNVLTDLQQRRLRLFLDGYSLKYVRLGAAKHDFEVLLISSWNRLGRDLSETLDTMTELKNQNIAVQSVKEKNLSLDRVLSIARFAAAMQIPDETLPEELDETPFEDQEESEGLDMTQSF